MARHALAVLASLVVLGTAASISRGDALQATACLPPVVGPGTGEGQNDPTQFPPTVGDLRIAMLFVDFADLPGDPPPSEVYESFVPRAVDWYRTVSYDRLRLRVTPLLRWIRLPGTVATYTNPGLDVGLRAALEEAVAAVDGELDFSRFHALYLVLPGAAAERIGGVGVLISEEPLRVDGVDLRIWAWLFEGASFSGDQHNYLAHETGHILGLPDLYVNRSRTSSHRWDIMASLLAPRGLFAWHRWKLGWLDPVQIACLGNRRRIEATLSPLERPGGTKAMIVRRGRYAYVAEVREPVKTSQGRVCKGGVLIYAVEFGAASGTADIRLRPAKLDTTALRVRCGPQAAAPFGRGRGEVSRVRSWGLQFDVLAALADGSFRVRVTQLR
jgi:M6 family metalloprotease-like protein